MKWTNWVIALSLVSCKNRDSGSDDLPVASSRATAVAYGSGSAAAHDHEKEQNRKHASGEETKNEPAAADKAPAAKTEVNAVVDEDRPADQELDKKKADDGGRASEGPARAWFPETFLFDPLVVTDDSGNASVDVRVPDRLTTWHVLALGHTREGAQAGATTSFLGTLPTYVDPIVPKRLVIGDDIRLPIQLVNTTTSPVSGTLAIDARNATLAGRGGARTIPAEGSLVDYVGFKADHPGIARLRVGLGTTDAVERIVEVSPAGKPVTIHKGGTLAGPRTLTIEGPADSDPATAHVRLLAFPGALALLRSELGVSVGRASLADDAYALLLAGKATKLLTALHDTPDPVALRDLSIVTTQRAIRDGRNLDVDSASLLTEAALAHADNPVLQRLGDRAATYLAQHQRPDGTFAGGTGWTLQRVLVATAEATRAVATATSTAAARQRAEAVVVKAGSAFERNYDHVDDGYTAAAILATGAVTNKAVADALRKHVVDAIKKTDDGAKYLDVADGVVRADGHVPTRAEATALAVLALAGDPVRADLGATLLGSYSSADGWGDGRANLECMRAVIDLFDQPIPADVKITLTMDGKPVVEGTLSRERLKDVLVLDAATPIAGSHTWAVASEPAVPGLGFSLELRGYVPWPHETVHGGLELGLPATMTASVGKPAEIALTAVGPSGTDLVIEQSLPAGVQVDRPSLEALVSAGTITRFETPDGTVRLFVAPLAPGATFAAKYRVIPTLAGKLHAAASSITAGTESFHVPPIAWTVN
jgi:hypothetical protein